MMEKNKKRLGILLLVLALLLALAGASLAWFTGEYNSYSRRVALAARYLEQEDYDRAVLSYQQAIQLRPEEAEAYRGLAEVYRTRGQNLLAQSVLRTGIDRTGSARLTQILETIAASDGSGAAVADAAESAKAGEGAVLNLQLLNLLGNSTYNDHRIRSGIESTEMTGPDECAVRVNGIPAVLTYRDDLDRVGGQPTADSYPAQAVLDDLSVLFGGAQSISASELSAQGARDVQRLEDDDGNPIIRFVAGNCQVTVAADANGNTLPNGEHTIVPLAGVGTDESDTNLSGHVISATTGSGVARAQIRFRTGSLTSGDSAADITCDEFGAYAVYLEPGQYTAEVQNSGYVTEYFPLYVSSGGGSTEDFVISPELSQGEIRIVLEWGSYPRDLDSYLDGTLDDGTPVHTSYNHRSASRGGEVIADLDVDDTSGFGPETTTIHNTNGTFTFTVKDYLRTGDMSSSGATVKIYLPDVAGPTTMAVPAGLENTWTVCTIDHGKLTF